MKTPALIGTLAATAAFATTGYAMDFQTDTFKTQEGKPITGENICIDGGMTRNMIYHNDFGWRLEK